MNQIQTATQIVEAYCNKYGLTPDDLRKRHGKRYIAKVIKGQNTAILRMVLAYYMYKFFPFIKQEYTSNILGYKCRSIISKHQEDVHAYLKTQDPFTTQYWNDLLETVRSLNFQEELAA